MSKKGFAGSWLYDNDRAPRGKAPDYRPDVESAEKKWKKRKVHSAKAWAIGLPKPSSPPTLWGCCTKATGDPSRTTDKTKD